MFGLPAQSEVGTPLPKTALYAKFGLKAAEREAFDADVSRIVIANCIDSRLVQVGSTTQSIYLLAVTLKRKNYDPRNIIMLSRLIEQNIVFALIYESEVQLATYCTRLVTSLWQPSDTLFLTLDGLNLDTVWDNLIASIGHITVAEGNSVAQQIVIDDARAKLLKQIEQLEKRARAEKQPRKKLELFEKIKELKQKL